RRRPAVTRLVGDEELDRRSEDWVGKVARGRERLELVAEIGAEEVVDCGEDFGARPVVESQRQYGARLVAPLAEDVHIGVPEAVERLELVTDKEQFIAGDQIDHVALTTDRLMTLCNLIRPDAHGIALTTTTLLTFT